MNMYIISICIYTCTEADLDMDMYIYIYAHEFDAIYIYIHDLSGKVTSPLTLHIFIFIWMFCNQAELAIVRSEAGEGAEAGLNRGFIIRFMGDRWVP